MQTEESVTHKLVERLSTWRGTALFHARDGRSLRGLVVRLFEGDPRRAREVVLAAMHRAIAVSHPVIDLALPESESGELVMVSDIWPGELLEKRLKGGPLPIGQALDVARNVAAGLAALHRTGLAHGGVHPANIWLAEDGAVRLLGLGLAAADPRPFSELAASEVAYLAPEVLSGGDADPCADIWSLGAVLRECLTGWSLYSGQRTTQVIRHILDDSVAPLAGQAPEPIERFLAETLRSLPRERLADGDAAHRALLEIPDFLPIDPTRPLDMEGEAPDLPAAIVGPVAEGTRIHGYQVLETLGRGGMGVVYRARDVRLERDVALKFLPLHVNQKQREDFEREARAASSLDHPNICTIYGIDETADGDTYIAMACYDAPSLGERLQSGPLELHEALSIGEQIASGLEAAHRIGLVHRDIKPGNILFSRDGVVKIVDFGLSAITEPGSGVIETEELYGTLGYVAPEILKQQPFDARVDIWALGVVIYEMVSGRRPFMSQELLRFTEVFDEQAPALGSLVPEVPPELEEIVDKALAQDPAQRCANAGEVAEALRRLRRGPEPEERRRVPLVAAFTILLLLLLTAGVLLWRAEGPSSASLPVAFAGIEVEGAPDWTGLALEELLELEIESRSRQTRRPPEAEARRVRESFKPEKAWSAAALDAVFAEAEALLLAGHLVPSQTAPSQTAPSQTAPSQAAPSQTAPSQTVPSQAAEGSDGTEAPTGELREGGDGLTARVSMQGRRRGSRHAAAEGTATTLPDMAASLASAFFGQPPADTPLDVTPVEPGGRFEAARTALAHLDSPAALAALGEPAQAPEPLRRLLLAASLHDLGREQEAQAAVDDLELADLPDPWRLYLRARQHDLDRNYPRAAALYRLLLHQQALEVLPDFALFEAASALIRNGEPQAALDLLDGVDGDPRADLVRADAYHWQGAYDRQVLAAARAAESAEQQELPFVAARAERQRSTALWRNGDLQGALEAARKAAELYRRLDHTKGQADGAMAQGIVLYESGELVLAKDSYDRAAHLYGSLGNRRAEARTLTNKALVLEQQGDLGAHLEVTERALELFRQREDRLAELITVANLALPLAQRGRLEEAREAFERAAELARQVDRFEDWVSAGYADFLLTMGQLPEARSHLEGARQNQQLAEDESGLALTQAILAKLSFQEGEIRLARELYDESLPVLEQRGTPGQFSAALRRRAKLALAEDDLDGATRTLDRAARLASPLLEKINVELARAEVALAGGRHEEARRAALETLSEFELRNAELPRATALLALAEIEIAAGDAQLALQRLDAALEPVESADGITLPPPLRKSIRLAVLRARSMQDRADVDVDVRPELQALLAEVVASGLLPLELEIRLALGEAEIRAGYATTGSRRLEDLATEASLKGFIALHRRARLARQDEL